MAGTVPTSIVFKVGTTDYKCEVTAAGFDPGVTVQQVTTLCPTGFVAAVGKGNPRLTATGLFDTASASLYSFLMANSGTEATFEYQPLGDNAKIAGTCIVVPPSQSSQANSFSTFTVSLPVTAWTYTPRT